MRRGAKPARREKRDNPKQAAENICRIRGDAIGDRVKRAAHHLSQAHKHQRDQHKKHAGHQFDRHDERAWVFGAIFRPEINQLRRRLIAHVDHQLAEFLISDESSQRQQYGDERKRNHPIDKVPPSRRGQTSHRHPQKRGHQHDVREKGEKYDHRPEKSDAGELEEKDEEADEQEISEWSTSCDAWSGLIGVCNRRRFRNGHAARDSNHRGVGFQPASLHSTWRARCPRHSWPL